MREILRLLLLVIVVLPLTLILAGPLLVVAAVRGSQAIGPIVLNPGHSKPSGRVAAFLLGVAIWLAVWGGTGLLLARYVPLLPVAAVPVTATSFPPVPSPTLGVSPAAAEAAVTTEPASPTPLPLPSQPSSQATLAQAVPVEVTPHPTTPPEPTPVPSLAPVTTPSDTPSPAVSPTLSLGEQTIAIAVIEQANELLRQAVASPTEDNLAALGTLWTGNALAKAQEFAREPSQMVGRPTEVSYAHLMLPVVELSGIPGHLTVSVTEVWTYSGPKDSHTESFEFIYTLAQQDGEWRILDYTYIDAPQNEVNSGPPSKYRPSEEESQP